MIGGVSGTAGAQEAPSLRELTNSKAITNPREASRDEVVAAADAILSRDVISDFIAFGMDTAHSAVDALASVNELGTRVQRWKSELESDPDSERLNYLLMVAAMNYDVRASMTGRRGIRPPVRIRIAREGKDVFADVADHGRNFSEEKQVALPEKALIGFVANSTTAKMREVTLIINDERVENPQWKTAQLGGVPEKGRVAFNEGRLELTGFGGYPILQRTDNSFFVYTEFEGTASLEVVMEEISMTQSYGDAGVMIRGTLDSSAPAATLLLGRDDKGIEFYTRERQGEMAGYLEKLCSLRPGDPDLTLACMQIMVMPDSFVNMSGAAYQAAERLLTKHPQVLLRNPGFFKNIYAMCDSLERFTERLTAAQGSNSPTNSAEASSLLREWDQLAFDLQRQEKHDEAIALWNKVEAQAGLLSLDSARQRIISYAKLEQTDEVIKALRKIFLSGSQEGLWNGEMLLSRVELSLPALVPAPSFLIYYAARYQVATSIAEQLEKIRGTGETRAAAKAIAIALRIAAKDAKVFAALKQSKSSFVHGLSGDTPASALALIAFELQQSPEGLAAAGELVERMATETQDWNLRTSDLLLWRLRIADLQKDPQKQSDALKALAAYVQADPRSGSDALETASYRLLKASENAEDGDSLLQRFRKANGGSRSSYPGDLNDYLKAYRGDAPSMPLIWTKPATEEVAVHWEYTVDRPYKTMGIKVLPMGISMPANSGRHTLEIYGVRAEYLSAKVPEEGKIASIPQAGGRGVWQGKLPREYRWIVALFRDGSGKAHLSPSIPISMGKNHLSPLHPEMVREGEGSWLSNVPSFWWAATEAEGIAKESVFISRHQPGVGHVVIKHRAIPIDPEKNYVFSGWMKSDVTLSDLSGQRDAWVYIVFYNAEGKPVTDWVSGPSKAGRWTLLTHQFGNSKGLGIHSIPRDAVSAEVQLCLRTQCEIGDIGFYLANGE